MPEKKLNCSKKYCIRLIPWHFLHSFNEMEVNVIPSCLFFGGRTMVGNSKSYLVSSEMLASSRIQLVDSNIFKSNGSPLSSPFMMVIEWHVAIPYSK